MTGALASFRGKHVLVVGAGRSGVAAARCLLRMGARVSLTDAAPRRALLPFLKNLPKRVRVETGARRFFCESYDLIIVSPGVPWDSPDLLAARRAGTPVWPEVDLGWLAARPRRMIGVTGTNGKSTTTAMIGHILRQAGRDVVVAGNIGLPLSAAAHRVRPRTHLVLELSSYQLEAHHLLRPDVGVVLNLSPDHLGRHKTMRRYAEAKARLFACAGARPVAVLNRRDPWCRRMAKGLQAAVCWFPAPRLARIAAGTPLLGAHNRENAMAAAAACLAAGVPEKRVIAGVASFKAIAHRLEPVRRVRGALFVNDSKATNVDATRVALAAFAGPVVLIMGGRHKGASYRPLRPLLKKRVRAVLAIGEAAARIRADLGGFVPVISCGRLPAALRRAVSLVTPGDVVLLSPACASFDHYRNFEERGAQFVSLVRRIAP